MCSCHSNSLCAHKAYAGLLVPAPTACVRGVCVCVLLQVTALTSQLSGIRVMCVDYRLAPLHPFPAGLSDALSVYKALTTVQGYKPSSIGLIGDSAGVYVWWGGAGRRGGGERQRQQQQLVVRVVMVVGCVAAAAC